MLEEENIDVTPESSSGESITEEQAVQTDPSSPEGQTAEVETNETPSSPDLPLAQQMDVDEMGVPFKNRYMESQRKLEKLTEQLNAVAEKLENNQSQNKSAYTIEELEAFAETTDDEGHRRWAKGEIRKLQKEEVAQGVKQEISAWQAAQRAEQVKAESFNYVAQRYPEAFKKNAQGQLVGWDNSSPMAQRIATHMQDPEIKDNPRGLMVAAALAYSELAPQIAAQASVKTTQAKAQVKDLQKRTLVEGGGVSSPPQAKTTLTNAKERLASTGSTKDGAQVFKEILKARGRISENS